MKFVVIASSLILFLESCVPPTAGIANNSKSSLSTVSLQLPSMAGFTEEQKRLLTGYDLIIKALEGSEQEAGCKAPIEGEDINPISTTSLPTRSVTQGCNYRIGFRMGQMAADGKSLNPIYFTNVTTATAGKVLKASDFSGQSSITLTLSLGVNKDASAAGFAKPDDTIVQDSGATMANINTSVSMSDNTTPQPPNAPRKVALQINEGYTPNSINVASGETIELVVTRTEANGCGGTLVLSDGRQLELKPGETKSITFTSSKSGEHPLTCGMGMYRGKILVQ